MKAWWKRNRTEGQSQRFAQSWFAALAGGSFPDWLVGSWRSLFALGRRPWSRDTAYVTQSCDLLSAARFNIIRTSLLLRSSFIRNFVNQLPRHNGGHAVFDAIGKLPLSRRCLEISSMRSHLFFDSISSA
jgi:hypothetical protein